MSLPILRQQTPEFGPMSEADIRKRHEENQVKIKELEDQNDLYQQIYFHQISKRIAYGYAKSITEYLQQHYSDTEEFLKSYHQNITMCPFSAHLVTVSKYDTRIYYDSVWYEWKGSPIAYFAADETSDSFYDECKCWNGLESKRFKPPFPFWKTEDLPKNSYIETTIQNAIDRTVELRKKNFHKPSFKDLVRDIPEEYHLIVVLFDKHFGYYHYPIHEELIPHAQIFSLYKSNNCNNH